METRAVPGEDSSRGGTDARELGPAELRRTVDPGRLQFESTEEIEPLVGTIGQPRALDAIQYGLEVDTEGFNLFVAGQPGSGRETTVLDYLRTRSATRAVPDDWVYVHNFASPDRPNAIRLPAGRGRELADAMDEFVTAARKEIPRAFESEDYDRRQREVLSDVTRQRDAREEELKEFAKERGFALEATAAGIVSVPIVDGEPLTRERFGRLPKERQEKIQHASKEVEDATAAHVHRLHQFQKEAARRVQELEREVALFATGPLFRDLEERFAQEPEVLEHLESVKRELVEHLGDFRDGDESPGLLMFGPRSDATTRFRVNVLVDNGGAGAAPVVVERNPTYYNLLGRMEYRAAFGSMVTDFREIKAGAFHRANGGFLVLDAAELLRHPFAWDALKRTLRSREVRIENLGEEFSPVPSASLRPEPVPLDVKVVLLGSALLHHVLFRLDDDFRELFKVKADFAPELDWTPEHHRNYAAFISRWVRDNGLRHFDAAAVASVIEYGARLREDSRKLSSRLIEISDVVSEASFHASQLGHALVEAADVKLAIRKKEYRSNLIEERLQELVSNGTIVIETGGTRVGQVNGLSILDLGDYSFGRPVRVTARVSLGRGGVASVEREIELSGPIHSKGVLILSGYLAATYAQDLPLAIAASLTFEQSYDEVDGDSASSTELYALVSALSGVPLAQSIAVTGSVDQAGNVQAVGGVTRKVEGFYATCKAAGLTGQQGVVIPAANVPNLMLDEEVVDAVRDGRFHVWEVRTIDEGIELLTGRPAAEVHELAAERVAAYASRLQAFAVSENGASGGA